MFSKIFYKNVPVAEQIFIKNFTELKIAFKYFELP